MNLSATRREPLQPRRTCSDLRPAAPPPAIGSALTKGRGQHRGHAPALVLKVLAAPRGIVVRQPGLASGLPTDLARPGDPDYLGRSGHHAALLPGQEAVRPPPEAQL